jgi:outer membrane protein TolC
MKLVSLDRSILQRQLLSDKNSTQALLDLTVGTSNENTNDWSIGLDLSYPLGNTKAKSALEKTQINLAKNKENATEKLLNLTIKTSVLGKKLQHLVKLLDTYQARINIADARALAEKKRYELGNSQVSFVISAQNNVHDVKLAYAQAAVKYQKSVLEFKAVIDQLM